MSQPAVREVTLVDVPVQTFWQLQRHQEDVLREFALIDSDRQHGGSADVPRALLDVVTELRSRLATQRSALMEELAAAAEQGKETVTVTVTLPVAAADQVAATCTAYERADEFCRSGDLLTLASTPEVVALRHELCEAIVSQLRA